MTLDRRVKRLFNEVDRDGNGIISASESATACPRLFPLSPLTLGLCCAVLELMRVVLGLRNSPGISAEASRVAVEAASGGGEGNLLLPLNAPPQYSGLVESMADDLAHALTDKFDETGARPS